MHRHKCFDGEQELNQLAQPSGTYALAWLGHLPRPNQGQATLRCDVAADGSALRLCQELQKGPETSDEEPSANTEAQCKHRYALSAEQSINEAPRAVPIA